MPQKLTLTLSPYYDDFNESKKFHRILFRPSVCCSGKRVNTSTNNSTRPSRKKITIYLKDGAQMIPGEISYDLQYYSIKLTSFTGTTNLSDFIGLTIVGQTSLVVAKVIAFDVATSTDVNTLYVKYTKTGVGNATTDFVSTETLLATHQH